MVKLRKAFSLNIHLHIRQGMLQRLWDKYVPTESPEYGQIQLVYLGEQARGGQLQSSQANLLISLVLKSRIMQMGLEKSPVKTAYVREQMENSLQRMERYYLTQLKCCNFVMYRKAERFMSLLEQAETSRNRYRKWQKESGCMERQRENYRMFSRFAVNIREFLAEHSQQAMRVQERELLHFLSKKEYREFCRLCRLESDQEFAAGQNVKWKKNKDKMFHSIERLETTKIRRLWAQMEHLEVQGGNVGTVLMHKLMQIRQQYRREIVRGFWEHVLSVLDSEDFKEAADMAEISRIELEKQLVEEKRHFEERDMQFSEERHMYQPEENLVQEPEEESVYRSEERRVYLSGQAVCEFLEHIESVLEVQKSRIEQQEVQMFASYQEIYQEAFASVWRESSLEEKAAREMLVNIYQMQEEKKEAFVEELAERILLRQQTYITDAENPRRSFGYTEHEIDGLISYIAYVIGKKEKRQAVVTEDTAERTFVHTTEPAEREAEELFLQIASVIEKKKSINTERLEEEVQEILSYIVDKREQEKYSEYEQTVFTVTKNMHHSIDGQEERRMLLHLHNLEAEKRTEFIEKLAERILLHQGVRETDVFREELSDRSVDTEEKAVRIFGYTGEQIEGLLSYVAHVAENKKKTGEMISGVSEVTERRTEETYATGEVWPTEEIYVTGEVRPTEEIYVTELAEREAEELFLQIASAIEKKKPINKEHFTQGEIEEIFSYIMDKRERDKYLEYEQTVFTVTKNMHHSIDGQEERRMLLYLHNLEAEERTEFIEKLAERVLLQQKPQDTDVSKEELPDRSADMEEGAARIFGYTGEQIEGLLSYVSYVVENKKEVHATELAEREAEELFLQITSVLEKKHHSVDSQEGRRMLLYLHNLEVEERTEFMEKLAERILLRQGARETDVSREELSDRTVDMEEESTRIFGYTGEQIENLLSYVSYVIENKKKTGEMISGVSEVAEEFYLQLTSVIEKKGQARLQRSIAGGQDISSSLPAPYEKLWEWGEALLFHPEQSEMSEEADFLLSWKDNGDKEEIQTEVIRRQIEAAKERNTLLQLIEQINHRIDFVQEEEKEALEPGEKLVYADSQLNQPEVKSLLHFIKDLDEGQYGKLVEELSEITKLQWKLHSQGSEEIETMQAEGSVAEQKDAGREQLKSTRALGREQLKPTQALGSLGRQYMAIAYPALVYRIEEFEKYRQQEVRGRIQSLGRMYLQQVGYDPREAAVMVSGLLPGGESIRVGKLLPGEEPPGAGNILSGEESLGVGDLLSNEESDNIWLKEGRMLDLQYSMSSPTVPEEEQQQERARMREESAQLKLAQEQIGQKLKEVEVQLQKVETSARAKEDVRAFAEQVKKQLYEELHVEKLRRGLI